MRIDLPSGAWAEVPDPKTLTNADRKSLMKAMRAGIPKDAQGDEFDPVQLFVEHGNVVVGWMVREWSFDLPLPKAGLDGEPDTYDVLDEIPIADYDAFVDIGSEIMPVLMPTTEAINSPPGEASDD